MIDGGIGRQWIRHRTFAEILVLASLAHFAAVAFIELGCLPLRRMLEPLMGFPLFWARDIAGLQDWLPQGGNIWLAVANSIVVGALIAWMIRIGRGSASTRAREL